MGKSHACNLATSPRLQKVRDFLRERGEVGATTMEIIKNCGVCAVNSIITELRRNGLVIDAHGPALNDQGARVYRYVLMAPAPQVS